MGVKLIKLPVRPPARARARRLRVNKMQQWPERFTTNDGRWEYGEAKRNPEMMIQNKRKKVTAAQARIRGSGFFPYPSCVCFGAIDRWSNCNAMLGWWDATRVAGIYGEVLSRLSTIFILCSSLKICMRECCVHGYKWRPSGHWCVFVWLNPVVISCALAHTIDANPANARENTNSVHLL